MRSKLFVPGSRPELFAKALAGAADALSFDLEDAVADEHKPAARRAVATWLASNEARTTGKPLIVRCNPVGSRHFEADVQAVVAQPALTLLNLPKVEDDAEVLAAIAAIERAEAQRDATATTAPPPLRLLVNIETPKALRRAAALARAHPRVAGLQLGLADLFEPAGIDRRDSASVHAAMLALRLAAAEAGVFACDAAFTDLTDMDGFRAEAMMARRLGYIGKSCIHPSQIAIANEAFAPSAQELDAAQRIVDAAAEAHARGEAAFVVDGKMIDPPFLKRAEALLAQQARAARATPPS
ncbi:MAG TPA: CoA ester lyase [Burkholderiaceae bacterium]|nr:CoA ester lyase [Burkholderiaceae bacterium]